ncbi:hypothetical protein BX661DRAFT_184449, partial [Kickxella alabastrina]|uniref:uncharacterized protein n=1 Tax=Kickxella alabastrina TaxID=61397 RepID=UPI00221FB60C
MEKYPSWFCLFVRSILVISALRLLSSRSFVAGCMYYIFQPCLGGFLTFRTSPGAWIREIVYVTGGIMVRLRH